MKQEPLNLMDFRKEFNIPAADLRAICKELNLDIIRNGTENYIVGDNPYNVSNYYFLKHAVMEYRATMYVNRTKAGEFMEYEIDIPDGGVGYVGIHAFDKDAVTPKTPSIKAKPKEQPKTVLVPVNKGTELMMRHRNIPPEPVGAERMDALQLLVEALRGAQETPPPPEPLHAQKTLLEAEEKGLLITTEQLGQVLGMSRGTISSKKSGFRKLGFEFQKVKEGTSTLWKAKRY